ncbi:hypothetical protein BWI97_07115 [Siphonobacter sp. BAB-5405]|uniref:hypothetical protein n=1 Tax=Siphonobacter sp. BAB-5405 TaxID=1864825 RepID=UPI000C8063C5|nr:hypothetical protein [Siphonobacter sp. BAB-5405]PMD97392.1 hypothetical protein BWI97_07115 [Siphonobacter sp. BAB-5405]
MKKLKNYSHLIGFLVFGAFLFGQQMLLNLFNVPGGSAMMGAVALVGLRRKIGGAKPGGSKRLYIAPIDRFQDVEWPKYEDGVAGEIAGTIPLISTPAAAKFVEIQAAYDTTKFGFASKGKVGNQSFEHNITFKVSRIDKQSIALATSLLNVPCVIIARGNDNQLYVIGTTEVPLELEISGDSGAKGADPKEMTFTCKNDGYMTPVLPMNNSVVFAIEPLPAETV